jgi:hypothetical protein
MPPVGFEPTIPANARLQTYALDRSVTGIGRVKLAFFKRTSIRELYLTEKGGRGVVVGGEWCGHPRQQSPSGGKLRGKMGKK